MVCEFGMSEVLGPRNYGSDQEHMFLGREISRNETHSEKITQLIDVEIDNILKEAHETAGNILKDHRDRLELIAELLIKYETLDGDQVMEILKTGKVPEELLKNGNGNNHAETPTVPEEAKAEEAPPAEKAE
jgi:cell division protease FtsH